MKSPAAISLLVISIRHSVDCLGWSASAVRASSVQSHDHHGIKVRSVCLLMMDSTRDSALKAFEAQVSTQSPVSSSSLSRASEEDSDRKQYSQTRRKRQHRAGRAPTVDSTLLRFINQQKEVLVPMPTLMGSPLLNENDTSSKALYAATETAQKVMRFSIAMNRPRSESLELRRVDNTPDKSWSVTTLKEDEEIDGLILWCGQYISERVQTLLLSYDDSLDQSALAKAGSSVQSHLLARIFRRRIRTFLRKRDETWGVAGSDSLSKYMPRSDSKSLAAFMSPSYSALFDSEIDVDKVDILKDSFEVMMLRGLSAKDIMIILQHSPGIVLMRPLTDDNVETCMMNGECLDETIDRIFHVLCTKLKLRMYDARKIVRASPGLLTTKGSKSAEAIISMFHQMGVSSNALARDKAGLQVMLSRPPDSIFRLVAFLASDAIRMPVEKIGPLLRRSSSTELLDAVAPTAQQHWHNQRDALHTAAFERERRDLGMIRSKTTSETYRKMHKTAWALRNQTGTRDLAKVVAAYPSVLLLDVEKQILPNAEYLMQKLGDCSGDLPKVLQLYPSLLGLPIESMEAVADYICSLGVDQDSRCSMFRSFPALLKLDIERNMKPVVAFLHSIGVIDIGRFLTRIPPVLGYSVERELLPKWRFLKTVSSDARFEVTKFPAYFSYPLERVIKARYEYIRDVKKFPTQLVNVERVVSFGDEDFATKILRDTDEGKEFRAFLDGKEKRARRIKKGNRSKSRQ